MSKSLTTAAIAKALGAKLIGDGTLTISRIAHPADATSPDDLALAIDNSLLPLLAESTIRAAVTGPEAELEPGQLDAQIVVTDRGRYAMSKLTALFEEPVPVPVGIHPTAVIDPSAHIGEGAAIAPFVVIGANATIGAHSVIHSHVSVGPQATVGPNALIYDGVRIGARCRLGANVLIHFNTTIGADGFSFVTPQVGSVESAKSTGSIQATNYELVRIASLGAVIIGDDVEIGANTSIDRGTIASTQIGNGTKIDNQVQIGHNVQIGENCLICGRVGIAGSATVGNRVVLGGAVGVADHVHIGDDSIAMAMSGIAGNIAPKSLVMGAPAKPREAFIEQMFSISRIKGLMQKVQRLTERVETLETSSKS